MICLVVEYRASTPQVQVSSPRLGKVDSAFHPFSGSIKRVPSLCLGTKQWEFSRQTDHLPETSDHAPQRSRSLYQWGKKSFISFDSTVSRTMRSNAIKVEKFKLALLSKMATDLTAVKGFILSWVWQFIQTIIKQGVDSSNGPKTRWPLFPIFISEFCLATVVWLNGYVNKQKCRIWSAANPQVRLVIKFRIDLSHTFGDRLISRFGPVNWPPRSCDLTPLDYFLWGYVKSLVYADKPQTLDHLEDNIRRVIADIRPQMLEKVIENWTSRLDSIRASRGSPMPEIIFKM
ncbi:uncharacterized protein TNCV_3690771 [Trichonephila clavipes]|nr:uncharacterized protein TNCV_3690771 [Trichonephila clavipes]